MGCRSHVLGRMTILAGSAQQGLDIPPEDLSLVVYNPSYATVYIRWGPDPVDVTDPRGWDIAVPGVALFSYPIPADVDKLSIDWAFAPSPIPGWIEDDGPGYGFDAVLVSSTPTNQGTFVGSLSGAPVPLTQPTT